MNKKLIIGAIFLLVTGAVIVYFVANDFQAKDREGTVMSPASEDEEGVAKLDTKKTGDTIPGWRRYTDEVFGITFQYPSEYGEIVVNSEVDGMRVLSFSKKGSFDLGAFVVSGGDRGGSIYDYSKYEQRGAEYILVTWSGQEEIIHPLKVMATNNSRAVIFNNESMTDSRDYIFSFGQNIDENIGAIIHVNRKPYTAALFVTSGTQKLSGEIYVPDESVLTLAEFEAVIRTVEVLD